MWFDSWTELGRVLTVGAAAYLTLVAVLRVSGKRTLAKLNAFDFIVTVALGSTLATIVLNSDVAWSEGAVALALLAGLQYAIAALASRIPVLRSVVTARPTLLVHEGTLLEHALRRQRVSNAEVRQALRAAGVGDLSEVAAVVLETDGTLSVIEAGRRAGGWALADVPEPEQAGPRGGPAEPTPG